MEHQAKTEDEKLESDKKRKPVKLTVETEDVLDDEFYDDDFYTRTMVKKRKY